MTNRPEGFDAFWDDLDQELATYPARPVLEPMPRHSTDFCTVYSLQLTSIGPYRIFGYLSVPKGNGPFPALINTPKYGSVNHVPDYNDRQRYVVLTIMHRGQRLADQPFAATYPGLLTLGISSPHSYIYRSVVADCLRGAEFLISRPEVDRNRVAVIGDDLALITAARRPEFAVTQIAAPMFYRIDEARTQTNTYPVDEVNEYLRINPGQTNSVAHTLSFFDPLFHASRVIATTLLSLGGEGTTTGLPWLQPLVDQLGGPVERYTLTNEGGTDHDQIDAWMAAKLGTEPMTRFIREFA